MTPAEWRAWTAPTADPALSAALLAIWKTQVLPRMTARCGLRLEI
jgi:hypothetical protein